MGKLLAVLFGTSLSLAAQTEVTLIAPIGIKGPIEDMLPGFEKKTGYKVKATWGTGLVTKKQVADGEPFDVPVVQAPYDEVVKSGHVVAASMKPLASGRVGVAVKKGAPKPDISSPDAVKKMLLSAKSVVYPNPARGPAAGITFDQTLVKLGIAEQVKPKLKPVVGAEVMKITARGDAEIGVTFLSELGEEPGIDIIGPLPDSIAPPTRLVGFISAHAKDAKAAKALLDYLSSPDAAAAYRRHRMEPGK
jgi:molybdate transport system substrate-binding protein